MEERTAHRRDLTYHREGKDDEAERWLLDLMITSLQKLGFIVGQRGRKNRSPLELEPLEKGKDKERTRENWGSTLKYQNREGVPVAGRVWHSGLSYCVAFSKPGARSPWTSHFPSSGTCSFSLSLSRSRPLPPSLSLSLSSEGYLLPSRALP